MALKLPVIIRIVALNIALSLFLCLFLMSCGNENKADQVNVKYGNEITPVEITNHLNELTNHDQSNIVIKTDLNGKVKQNQPLTKTDKNEIRFHFNDTEIKISKDYIEIKIPTNKLVHQDNGNFHTQNKIDNRRKVNLKEKEKLNHNLDSDYLFHF